MEPKRFQAPGMQEAIAKIRKELGEDAVILSTRRLRVGSESLIEVTAGRPDQSDQSGHSEREKRISVGPNAVFEHLNGRMDEIVALVKEIKGETLGPEIQDLKSTLGTVFDLLGLRNKDTGYMTSIYYRLLANGVSSEMASRLVDKLRANPSGNGNDKMKEIEKYLQTSIPVSVELAWGRRTIAFVGPPGVGKTTTMAKLAARYAIEEKASVGLITTDTFKIGAAEQLRVFSRITGLPLEVVTGRSGREGLGRTIEKFSDKDVILIDTPGLSQANNHFAQLSDALRDQRIKTHLLLSPAVARENSIAAARKFGSINYNSIILTKLDECTRFGSIYDIIDQVGKPVSFITTGQNITQDIETADPGRIARLITENKLS